MIPPGIRYVKEVEIHGDATIRRKPKLATDSQVQCGHAGQFVLTGELTIKDVTLPVDLSVELEGVGRSPYGQDVFGFSASAEIDREAFGITWNVALETGGVMVGKKIKIEIEGEAIRQAA